MPPVLFWALEVVVVALPDVRGVWSECCTHKLYGRRNDVPLQSSLPQRSSCGLIWPVVAGDIVHVTDPSVTSNTAKRLTSPPPYPRLRVGTSLSIDRSLLFSSIPHLRCARLCANVCRRRRQGGRAGNQMRHGPSQFVGRTAWDRPSHSR